MKVYKGRRKRFLFGLSIAVGVILLGVVALLCIYGGNIPEDSAVGQYLPDTLGGMIGILIGFLFEFLVFEKIRDLKKFETLYNLLDVELDDVLLDCLRNIDSSVSVNGGKIYEIMQPVLEDIMDSAENLVLFNKSRNPEILEYIRQVNCQIIRSNIVHGQINQFCDDKVWGNFKDYNIKAITYIIMIKMYFGRIKKGDKICNKIVIIDEDSVLAKYGNIVFVKPKSRIKRLNKGEIQYGKRRKQARKQ